MIYLTCPTCGFFLGAKTIEFETKRNETVQPKVLNKRFIENETSSHSPYLRNEGKS